MKTPKNPADMLAHEINRELDRLDRKMSRFTDDMIAAGRGHQRHSEWAKMDDPLAARGRDLWDRYWALQIEIELRYGPNNPSRLPRGFGPRK